MTDEYEEVETSDFSRAVNIFRRNEVTVQVPLKYNDEIVGKATCHPDGTITCEFNHSRMGLKLHDLMTEGILDHLTLDDNIQPAVPSQEKRI